MNKSLLEMETLLRYCTVKLINMRGTYPGELAKKIKKMNEKHKLLYFDIKNCNFHFVDGLVAKGVNDHDLEIELNNFIKMVEKMEKEKGYKWD